MPRLLLFAPAQFALVDSASNGLSVVNIIESIGVPNFPGVVGGFFAVSWWLRSEDEADVRMLQRVEFKNPTGQVVGAVETPFLFDRQGHRVLNLLPRMNIAVAGVYDLQIHISRQGQPFGVAPAGSVPILIQQVAAPRPVMQPQNQQIH